MTPVDVRPMRPADIAAAEEIGFHSIGAVLTRYEIDSHLPERTPELVARGLDRIRHLLATDPGGAWVASAGDRVVGVALALVRGPLWFLSLLAVDGSVQSSGLGRRLLDATLSYGSDTPGAWILATPDPRALRRYAAAGFALHPAFRAAGPVDRTLLPAGLRVRDGDLARDRDLVEDVVIGLRGAPYGPDLDRMLTGDGRLLIADDGGFAVTRPDSLVALGARRPETAAELLWAVLAETHGDASVLWLTATQPWAVDVALAARLSLLAGPSSCVRGDVGPLTPYLPAGSYG